MQFHVDWKDKVALDEITLWAHRCMKGHGNTISCFHLIEHYVSGEGEFFTENYIL